MKVLVVFNPISGMRHIKSSAAQVQKYLAELNVEYTWFETVPAPRQPLEQFLGTHFDRIIAIGGDGTVRDTAHFILEHDLNVPLGIVAQGSFNMVPTSLGIPVFPLKRVLKFALQEQPQPLDVLRVNGGKHYALIAAGQGYDSVFIQGATRRLKRQLGIFAYLISFLRTFFIYRNRPYTLVIDGKRHYVHAKLVMVMNMFTLQGLHIDRAVSPQDGILDVYIVNPRSLVDACIATVMFLLWKRKRTPRQRIHVFTGKSITVKQRDGTEIQLDGEVYREKQLRIEVLPGALQVVFAKKFA